jgi:DNA-binding transcriptional regulator YiaG
MTPLQFRRAISELGLSQLAAARMLGYDGRTVRRWIAGEIGVPPAAAKLLRLAADGKLTVREIEFA